MITDQEYRARCEWRKEGFWIGVRITPWSVLFLGLVIASFILS